MYRTSLFVIALLLCGLTAGLAATAEKKYPYYYLAIRR